METEFNKVNPEQEADKPKKCACRHKHGKHVAVILIVLILGAICWHVHPRPTWLKVGTVYTVELRRDSAGGSAPVTISGTLIAINREAILLEVADHSLVTVYEPGKERVEDKYQKTQFWIPKRNILFVKREEPRYVH